MLIQPSGVYVIQTSFLGFVCCYFFPISILQIKSDNKNDLTEAPHGYVF